jgi:hypothetical protein
MSRQDARDAWEKAGFNYLYLTIGRLQMLRDLINEEMKSSNLIPSSLGGKGTFRMNSSIKSNIGFDGIQAELTCKSRHFEKREAVTFNGNGFIGFGGWADEQNIQPILSGFLKWIEWLKLDSVKKEVA